MMVRCAPHNNRASILVYGRVNESGYLRSDVEASSPMTGLDKNLDSKLMALSRFW